jgi:hypothetical protein
MRGKGVWFVFVAVAAVMASSQAAAQGRALTFITIDFPGSVLTNVQGINASGDIVGFYNDANGRAHGFVRSAAYFVRSTYLDQLRPRPEELVPQGILSEVIGDLVNPEAFQSTVF